MDGGRPPIRKFPEFVLNSIPQIVSGMLPLQNKGLQERLDTLARRRYESLQYSLILGWQ